MRITSVCILAALAMFLMAAPAMAAGDEEGAAGSAVKGNSRWFDNSGAAFLGAAIGAGLVVMGGAAGIGWIGGRAAESIARQPEAVGSINGVALITAAMIEGATLFAVVVCLLGMLWGKGLS